MNPDGGYCHRLPHGVVLPIRVIAGTLKSRLMKTPRGGMVRPTSDRVRESLFSIVERDAEDCCVLDLFAGAGSLGIEAISRGASHVTFVENSPQVVPILKENIEDLDIRDRTTVMEADVLGVLKEFSTRRAKFGMVFMDPPYSESLAHRAMEALALSGVVAEDGIVVAEHRKTDLLEQTYGELTLTRVLKFGDTWISIYRREPCRR